MTFRMLVQSISELLPGAASLGPTDGPQPSRSLLVPRSC
jgi:hypothetical protein